MHYCNRTHAGEELAAALQWRSLQRPLVLGINRSGVLIAIPIARVLGAELGFMAAMKLRAPWNHEVALGAITAAGLACVEGPASADRFVDQAYLSTEKAKQMSLARQRERRFGVTRGPLNDRHVILVHDGIATSAIALAAIRSIRSAGAARVILASPVALPSALPPLRREATEVICLKEDPQLFAVGEAYGDFQPIEDAEVDALLRAYRRPAQAAPRSASRLKLSQRCDEPLSHWGAPTQRSLDWVDDPVTERDGAERLYRS
jgi:putative phosphoribosyl transferase